MRVRRYISAALLLSFALNASAQITASDTPLAPRHHLMPVPAAVRFGAGRLAVNKSFMVAARGHVDGRLRAGVARVVRRLEGRTVLELPLELSGDANAAALVVECKGPGQNVSSVEEDESYTLDVTDRQAVLRAATVVASGSPGQ